MSNLQTFQVPQQNFKLEAGTPKVYTKVSDFGRVRSSPVLLVEPSLFIAELTIVLQEINLHFCSTCGTSMYRTGGSPRVQEMVGIRAGVLVDDPLLDEAPKMEVYVEKRPKWRAKIEGAMQLSGKYEVIEEGAKNSTEYETKEG